jgi:hypothetical protein
VHAVALGRIVLAVRRPEDEDRELAFASGPIDVGAQDDAVAHRHRNVYIGTSEYRSLRFRGAHGSEPSRQQH